MLRRFGKQIWRQSRDISVYNYEKAMIYEIWTNHGYLYVSHNKDEDKVEVINGLAQRSSHDENRKSPTNKETAFFFPPLH